MPFPDSRGRSPVLAALTIAALALSAVLVAAPSYAATDRSPESGDPISTSAYELTGAETAELEALLGAMDATTNNFDGATAQAAGASDQGIADFSAALGGAGWTISGDAQSVHDVTPTQEVLAAAASGCKGRNGYTGFHGVFWQWAANSCNTDALITLTGTPGAAVAGIGGLLAAAGVPPGAVIAAVGFIMGLGVVPLVVCKNVSGTGSVYVNIFPTGAGCWGQ